MFYFLEVAEENCTEARPHMASAVQCLLKWAYTQVQQRHSVGVQSLELDKQIPGFGNKQKRGRIHRHASWESVA